MNNFERVAIFTLIEGIEGQLRGLKTLLAAGGNQDAAHKTTAVPQYDPTSFGRLTAEQEAEIETRLGMRRQEEIDKMQHAAGAKYGELWTAAAAEAETPSEDDLS